MNYWQRKAQFIFFAALFAIGASATYAMNIEAFCTGNLGARQIGGSSIYYPNAHKYVDAAMSQEMRTAKNPKQVVMRHEQAIKRAMKDFAYAQRLGVKSLPAVVFDHRWVVLGSCDIGKARSIYVSKVAK